MATKTLSPPGMAVTGLCQALGSEATFLAGAAYALIAALGLLPLRHKLA